MALPRAGLICCSRLSVINPLARELSAKIVFYGAGLSGKTTTLQAIYAAVRPERRGELVSLATETDRTIFFDFLPLQVERIQGLGVRFQLYTVPGQVFYAATRRLVLSGADGVVFVADSQPNAKDSNLESFESLRENMSEVDVDLEDFPIVFQYNKRDLPNAVPMDELSRQLNQFGAPEFGTCATTGEGTLPLLRAITKLVLSSLTEQQPAVRRQIVDGDEHEHRERESIARSVFDASTRLAAATQPATAEQPKAAPSPGPVVAPAVAGPAPQAPRLPTSGVTIGEPANVAAPARSNSIRPVPVEVVARAPGKLSFAALWPPEREPAVQEIEACIARADSAEAVRGATQLLAEMLDSLPGPHGGAGAATKVALLGLDGGLYLRVCRLSTMPKEAQSVADALLALHVLVSARLKIQTLGH